MKKSSPGAFCKSAESYQNSSKKNTKKVAPNPGFKMCRVFILEAAMRITVLIVLVALTIMAGCSTPLTERAARVRVIPYDAAAMSSCKTLGLVAGRSHPVLLESAARSEALAHLRDAAARMDADAVAIVSTTSDDEVVTLHGVALKCF